MKKFDCFIFLHGAYSLIILNLRHDFVTKQSTKNQVSIQIIRNAKRNRYKRTNEH